MNVLELLALLTVVAISGGVVGAFLGHRKGVRKCDLQRTRQKQRIERPLHPKRIDSYRSHRKGKSVDD